MNDRLITIEIHNYKLLDTINNLAKEYSVTSEFLINVAIEHLLKDINMTRELRTGTYKIELFSL